MFAYLDSSAVLRWLLEDDQGIQGALRCDSQGASELLRIEVLRVLDRLRLMQQLDDTSLARAAVAFRKIYDSLTILPLSPAVKHRAAESFPTSIGTLDALHLASALLWADAEGQELHLYSYDRQMNICARTLGAVTPLDM